MTDEQNRERSERQGDEDSAVYRPPSSSSDLLDLVRSAEDDARLALRKRTPAVPMQVGSSDAAARNEEFVDVGDEAVDAPPSLPPLRSATPAGAFSVPRRSSRPPAEPFGSPSRPASSRALAMSEGEGGSRPWSPAVGIALVLALAVGALAVFAR